MEHDLFLRLNTVVKTELYTQKGQKILYIVINFMEKCI